MDNRQIKEILYKLEDMPCVKENKLLKRSIYHLKNDIEHDLYTVLVLGEFKRGKSTFINALLGNSILPMDVLPETATINAIMYNEKPCLSVVYNDGHMENGTVSEDYLKKFSARRGNDEFLKSIRYIKLGYPVDMLKNRIVLIDTPGVSDINKQRVEVTYQFLPRANAVIFILDATSPLKKTEKDFIEQKIAPLGIRDIMFLVNKYDCIYQDDEEDDDDILNDIKERIESVFKVGKEGAILDSVQVYPISAKNALIGILRNKLNMVKYSGLPEVKEHLQDTLCNSDIERRKNAAYNNRLKQLLKNISLTIDEDNSISRANVEELNSVKNRINKMLLDHVKREEDLASYADFIEDDIILMADRSIKYFQKKLVEDIDTKIQLYKGTDFKLYIEKSISLTIQRNFESWIRVYSPRIDRALYKMENELAKGLSRYFKRNIALKSNRHGKIKGINPLMHINVADLSEQKLKINVTAAIGSIGLYALLGSVVMPAITLAALPYFRDRAMKQELEKAKESVLPEIKTQISNMTMQLQQEVHKYIKERIKEITANSEAAYQTVLKETETRLKKEIVLRKTETENINAKIESYEKDKDSIKMLVAKISEK